MYARVLVGTDGSATATRAVEAAARLAMTHGAELVVAHAFSPRASGAHRRAWLEAPEDFRWQLSSGSMAEDTMEAAIRHARAVTGGSVPISGRFEPGTPVQVLLELIDDLDPDVLVIGNRDISARIRTRRSVSRALVRRASCDVVLADTLGRRQQRRGTRWAPLSPQLT